jgi:hypothetical protein
MNELDVARSIATGELPSPQRFGDSSLVSLRISGTGAAERPSISELVWRDPAVWLSSDTLARVAGLPVVIDHPESSSLNAAEYAARSVGGILHPYVADRAGVANADGPDLWGIARLFLDPDQVAALPDMSTSPSVTFTSADGNQMITLPDGQKCLVEASPTLIDHVAIVTNGAGVWDKGLPNSGIRSDSEGNPMPPEDEGNIDKILAHIDDAIGKRFDAMETRHRRDSEREGWMKADAAGCARDDAEEEKERGELEAKGDPKEVAADKARKARKDRMDKRRSDANPLGHYAEDPERQRKLGRDDAAERKISADNADVQARFDTAAGAWGERAPPPMQAEQTLDYRVRLARYHQKHCTEPSFKDLDLAALAATHADALDGIERRIIADSVAASRNPQSVDHRNIKRTRIDPESGHRITEFFGGETIFKQFSPPSQRVTAFKTPNFDNGRPN